MATQYINSEQVEFWKGCILTYGHFSTIHPGHIRYLRHARSLGGKLVVALIGDDISKRYPFNQKDRADALGLLGIADAILPLESDDLDQAIDLLIPSVLVLGNEYKEMPGISIIIEKQRNQNRSVQFHAGDIYSSSAYLLTGSERDLRQERRNAFRLACNRQNLDFSKLIKSIDDWSNANLLVLGDTIVDQYVVCEAVGMSAEAPVVVVKELEHKDFIGGAGVVAAHIAALGASCHLISVVGADSSAEILKKELVRQTIGDGLCIDSSRPTTFKKRYLVENQKLFRVSRLEDKNIDVEVENEVIKKLELLSPKANGIVISDFVYGVVTPRILAKVHYLAEKHNLQLFGDLQCSSQVGSVIRFKNFSLLCPNEREARVALQDKDSGLEQLSQRLLKTTNTKRLVMKLGSEGFIAYDCSEGEIIRSQSFPALSVNPLDVAGAGDSLLALFATGLASGQSMMPTAALASCMASIAVETMGNTPISASNLRNSLEEVLLP